MKPVQRRIGALAVILLAASTVAACGKSANGSGTSTDAASSKPVDGGTLRFISAGDVDHLDPLSAYYTPSVQLEQAWTRQLVSYLPSNNLTTATTIAADVATVVPTRANGGISPNGLTYTFHIRPGVMWNTSPARQVTSYDFLREFKAMCNPTAGVGNPLYYVPVITGMSGYCHDYAADVNANTATATEEADFQNSHSISGISTPNSMTIRFSLIEPANDFLNIMAMSFASARPVEYDKYLPDSNTFRQHTISDGPYQISTYVPLKQIVMTRNPAWKQSSDPLRHQYVNKITVTEGVGSSQTQLNEMQAGAYDLMWDTTLPTSAIPQLEAQPNSGLHIYGNTGQEAPYLVFNEKSPDAGGAMGNLKVRIAMEYAINKVQIAKIFGGVKLNPVLNGAIAPGNVGYTDYDYYPTPGNEGDPAKCKSLLAAAGYPHGFTIIDAYRTSGEHPEVFQAVQADLKACGITVKGSPQQDGPYYDFLEDAPNSAKANQWDISEPIWAPDWEGNNGRANAVPMYETNCTNGTTNFGCYNNLVTDADIQEALEAPTEAAAAPAWAKAGQQVMKDAAIVPFTTQDVVLLAGKRVQNLIYNPEIEQYNITQLWLNPPTP
ncbi:MAG TPA: ABC transporter substrate-binding protein [Streptosporangiaceae bacterium]